MSKSNERSRLGLVAWSLLGGSLLAGGIAWSWLIALPDVAVLAQMNPSSTALMQARAAQAREEGHSARPQWTWVPLAHMPPHLIRAVLVAEDASFFFHEGFDWEGIKDALWRDVQSGRLQRGGSTISQQLAKNLYLTADKTLTRKLKEALITRSLEHRLTKRRILELYLNVVEWGNDVYGAEAAARHHFGKSARDLTAEEAALLAAILPSPRSYDPLPSTSSYLTKRQQQILRWMERRGSLGLKSVSH
jgi:monofunctional biosynthetic peptidoglycan transglycosylase